MTRKRRFLSLLIVLTIIATMAPWSALVASASYTGVLQFDNEGKFTVLQLADIQENGEVEPEIIDLITKAIARYSPDLVVFTGDNVRGFISSKSFKAAVDQFLAPLLATNTKFAVTFGNHDDQGVWPTNPGSREEQYSYYKTKGGGLFVDYDVPSLDGTGSGSIPIYSFGQSSGSPAFQLFLMDSGGYINVVLDLDNVKTSQIDYFLTTNPMVPSLWFQHIPVPDFYNLFNQVPAGTADSFEGSHDPFKDYTWALNTSLIDFKASGSTDVAEIYKEAPGPTNLSTYQESAHRSSAAYGSKTIYEAWCSNGNMKGAFFGHNHINSFVGTTGDGITLGYGKAATLQGYNDLNPGCRVFEIDDSGSYTTISATRSALTNYPVGDYTAVNNAIAAARVISNGSTYFRANSINDPAYYFPASTTVGKGVYAPSSFVGNAVALQTAIDSVEHNLDSRSQSSINAFAASITSEWNAVSLKYADYSAVNQMMGNTLGGTILAPPYYSSTHAGQWLPETYFTEASLSAWHTECSSVVYNLKLPSQATVNGYASSMEAAYQGLRLKHEYAIANLEVFTGSSTVINQTDHFVYGLEPGLTQAEFESNFIKLYGNAHLSFTYEINSFGTGTKVELIDNTTGFVLQTYFIVIFGDVNGDGNVDSIDAGVLVDVENGAATWDTVDDTVYLKAGDLNGDGNVDSIDAGLAVDYENSKMNIDQTTGMASQI